MTRPTRLGRKIAFAIIALFIIVIAVWLDLAKIFEAEPEAGPAPRETTEVRTQALAERFEADGQMTFAGAHIVQNPLGGSVHDVVAPEDTVVTGDTLFRVNGEPVILLEGSVPAFRTMEVDTEGVDVAQLETNLVAMGFDPDVTVTVDSTFTANTAAMVERWQLATGQQQTGSVELGAVVFGNSEARVGAVGNGGDAGGVLTLTAAVREVEWSVPPEEIEDLSDEVLVRLADRSTFMAPVASRQLETDGSWTLVADVPADAELPALDLVDVSIEWSSAETSQMLTVPAGAVVRLDSGVHALEVVRPSGATTFVPVEVSAVSGATVGVTSPDIDEGDTVINP